jgi:hypothetical protein
VIDGCNLLELGDATVRTGVWLSGRLLFHPPLHTYTGTEHPTFLFVHGKLLVAVGPIID